MKSCTRCKEVKDLSLFYIIKKNQKPDSWCKACRVADTTKFGKKYRAQNTERVQEYLKNHPCVDCGEDNIFFLEFDHILGETKVADIATLKGRAWKHVEAELGKCEVRCSKCHRIKTSAQLGHYSWIGETPDKDDLGLNKHSRRGRKNQRKIYDILSKSSCVDCGESDRRVLDFDHIMGEKIGSVSTLKSFAWSRIQEEIDKCVIRCVACHKVKTAKESNFYACCS